MVIDLPLSHSAVGWACEALRAQGFFYGALLPEAVNTGDVLRLQRLCSDATPPSPATPGAQRILKFIEHDRVT